MKTYDYNFVTKDVARELARRYSTMTHEELDILKMALKEAKYQKGEFVVKEGDRCQDIYWITKGMVRQYYIKADKEVTEYLACENHIAMCIESLFKEEPSKQMIVALENTVIYRISKPILEQIAMRSVNIQILFRKILEESLVLSQVKADLLRFSSVRDRYLRFVEMEPEIIARAPLVHIASLLQMTPESLSRVRSTLSTSSKDQ